jgi:uncharacterized flavoprotein (TIGR03862 family)
MKSERQKVAIIGSGPAGLMAASQLSDQFDIHIFEKNRSLGPKILLAGKSGLNISSSLPFEDLLNEFRGPQEHFQKVLENFSVKDWLSFIHDLGLETFEGTSRRHFVKEMKAGRLVKEWKNYLISKDIHFHANKEFKDFKKHMNGYEIFFNDNSSFSTDKIIFALGGASSFESDDQPAWIKAFENKGISIEKFQSSNAGFHINASSKFFEECEGQALKNITVASDSETHSGEVTVTNYGLEGTPIYRLSSQQTISIDLKPHLSESEILEKTKTVKENLNPLRLLTKVLKLDPIQKSFLFHFTEKNDQSDLGSLIHRLKNLPITLTKQRPLSEAISSSGGIKFNNLNENLEFKGLPGVYACGEMLDWDAPTGGFWIQGCVSQGAFVAKFIDTTI